MTAIIALAAQGTDASGYAFIGLCFASVFVMLYLAPGLLAYRRGHPNRLAILMLNALLGWSFIGWVIALVWALSVPADRAGVA